MLTATKEQCTILQLTETVLNLAEFINKQVHINNFWTQMNWKEENTLRFLIQSFGLMD